MFDLYCDYCEREGHAFNSCPRRDDDEEYPEDDYTHALEAEEDYC